MARRTGTTRTLISSVAVAVAIFAAVMAFESRSTSFDEAGSAQSNSSSGGMAADMPGMDMSGDHEHATTAASARPLAPVLGTFGGGTSAVLLTAGFLRRKDRAANQARKAATTARRNRK